MAEGLVSERWKGDLPDLALLALKVKRGRGKWNLEAVRDKETDLHPESTKRTPSLLTPGLLFKKIHVGFL